MRDARGQGTVEWIGIVLLVALVLAATIAVVPETGIGERVTGALRRALCVVTGGACTPAERAAALPCVVAADERSEGGAFTVALVRIGERDGILREVRSDGTVALTLIDEDSAGLRAGSPSAHVRWGSFDAAVGRELRAAVLARRGAGATWIARDAQEADRLQARIRLAHSKIGRRAGVTAPPPDVEYREHGTGVTFAGRGLELGAGNVAGERVDHRRGWRTVYVREDRAAGLTLSFGRHTEVTGEAAAAERIALTYDRSGRPIDLMVLGTLDVAGAAALPDWLAPAAGALGVPLHGERHIETERHLDLADPANAGAARAFLRGLGEDPVGLRLAADGLRERLEAAGTLSVRSYARGGEERGAGANARLVGMEVGSQESWARLGGALRRGPDGALVADAACAPLGA